MVKRRTSSPVPSARILPGTQEVPGHFEPGGAVGSKPARRAKPSVVSTNIPPDLHHTRFFSLQINAVTPDGWARFCNNYGDICCSCPSYREYSQTSHACHFGISPSEWTISPCLSSCVACCWPMATGYRIRTELHRLQP